MRIIIKIKLANLGLDLKIKPESVNASNIKSMLNTKKITIATFSVTRKGLSNTEIGSRLVSIIN